MVARFASSQKGYRTLRRVWVPVQVTGAKNLFVKGSRYKRKGCRECWSPDHPQLRLGEFPVNDPQAIRNPRPDPKLLASGDLAVVVFSGGGTLLVAGTIRLDLHLTR